MCLEISGVAHFGETLRGLIKGAHLANSEFAKQAGISADTLYRNLRSEVPLGNKSTYRQMAGALGITAKQLDAKWKEDQPADARTATPTVNVVGEGNVDEVLKLIRKLSLKDQKFVLAGLEREIEDAQNVGHTKPARTASQRTA